MLFEKLIAASSSEFEGTISFVDSATGSSTIVVPATTQTGDVIFIYNTAEIAGGPTPVYPTGYTTIIDVGASTSYRAIWSYKIATGLDSGATVNLMTQNATSRLAVFRPSSAIQNVQILSRNFQVTNATPTTQTVTSGSGLPALIVLGGNRADSAATANFTFSPTQTATVPDTLNNYQLRYIIYNTAPSNVTVSQTDAGNGNILTSFYARFE
jgi:hypothetical protein